MKTLSAQKLIAIFALPVLILSSMAVVSLIFDVNFGILTRDVTATAKIHPLTGILSSLGMLFWCTAASMCFLAATILQRSAQTETFQFFLASALLSTYLLIDDFFLFHEELAPRYLHMNEKLVMVALGIAVIVYLFTFRRLILQTNFALLLLALGFLGLSTGIDVVLSQLVQMGQWEPFYEDGAKWLGITSWCSYFVVTSRATLLAAHRTQISNANAVTPRLPIQEFAFQKTKLR